MSEQKREQVGVRELRQNLSKYLDMVKAGRTLEVTERNRPVAVLAPLSGETTATGRLVASGRATAPSADLLDVVPGGQLDGKLIYLDPSAILKFVLDSPETFALRDELTRWPERVTSRMSAVEVVRAARTFPGAAEGVARRVLDGLALVNVDEDVLRIAAGLEATGTTEAVHVATALSLGDDFGLFVSYDGRMLLAADAAGLDVLVPGASP